MARDYASFLIRWWRREGDGHQIKVEHIQSGETVHLQTLAQAISWIEAHRDTSPGNTGERQCRHQSKEGEQA